MPEETLFWETLFWLNFGVAWAGLWFGIGLAIAAILHAGKALYHFIKRKVREHERIVNEKILRGIK